MPLQVGDIVEGKVADIMNYGVFVRLEDNKNGLVHISEVSKDFVEDITTILKKGDIIKVKVLSIDQNGKIALSIKRAITDESRENKPYRQNNNREKKASQPSGPVTLDDMLSKFLKDSDERQLDLKRNIESKRGSSKRRC